MHGFPCVPSVADLPEAVDAVVVAIPAARGARRRGGDRCARLRRRRRVRGGLRGIAPTAARSRTTLVAAARVHDLPVCGPNGNGIVSLPARMALWGDMVAPREAGPVALISQSGNVAVNALASRRGLRLHTVVSLRQPGRAQAADWLDAVAELDGVRSVALYLEADGDGERWCAALERCARAGIGVAVLKAGSSAAGAAAAQAHTGAVAGDQRIFRALAEEAGAAWARDPHELLEQAKALAVPGGRRAAGTPAGVAVMTCSGGDSSVAADLADELGVTLPRLDPATVERLREVLPGAATAGNPLDYTSLLWDEPELLAELVRALADDPLVGRLLVLYDEPDALEGAAADTWGAVLDVVRGAAREIGTPVAVASTLPELLPDGIATMLLADGLIAVAGLREGVRVMRTLDAPPPDPDRIAQLRAAAARAVRVAPGGARTWRSEHDAKALLIAAGIPVPEGRIVHSAQEAADCQEQLGGPVAVKLTSPDLRHKSELGAFELNVDSPEAARAAYARLRGLDAVAGAHVLVERMAAPGAELLVAARTDAVVPALVVGLGGVWTEALADVAVIPLPATPERVEAALRGLRGAPLLTGHRGRPALAIGAAAALAARAGDLLLDAELELLELNPVIVGVAGAVAVDALASAPASPSAASPPTPVASGGTA